MFKTPIAIFVRAMKRNLAYICIQLDLNTKRLHHCYESLIKTA